MNGYKAEWDLETYNIDDKNSKNIIQHYQSHHQRIVFCTWSTKKGPWTKQFYFVAKNNQAVRLIKSISRKTLSCNSQLKR